METKNKKDYDLISSFMKDFTVPEINFQKTFKAIDVEKYKKTNLKENIKETAFDVKLKPQLIKKNKLKRGVTFYPAKRDFQKQDLRETVKDIGLFDKKNNKFLILRKIPKISQQEYDNMKNNFINVDTLAKLFNYLKTINCNFKSVACYDSIGGISPLTYLIESKYQANKEKAQEMKNKYDILQNFIMNYRTINGDGNCFYRAVMFRYLEILVLTKNIEQLQNVVFDFINSFNSEKLKSRMIIRNMNIKPDLSLKILILIVDLLKNNMVEDAHQILVKSFSTCQKFDYAMILYLRYLLYDYIKQNENKTYLKTFPIKIGNLLPYQFETEDGKFLFDDFYEKYLLNFFTDAEKIVIYLTPFVLQIEIDVIIFDDNEKEILKSFKWEGNSELKINEVISLLNHKNHYEIIYTPNDYKKYQKIFEIYENKQKSIILSQIDQYLNPDKKTFNSLSTNIRTLDNAVSIEDEIKCSTMIFKKKKKKNNINEANNNAINNISRNANNNNQIIQNANDKDLSKINEKFQNNENILNNTNSQSNNQPKSTAVNIVNNGNNNRNIGYSRNNIKNQNINNNQPKSNYNNGNLNQRDTNIQNNTNNSNNNNNNQNNINQRQYKHSITNHNNKPNNINENNSKINNDKNQTNDHNNSLNQNYNNNYKEKIKNNKNYLNQYCNNNTLNGNHNLPNAQNLPHKNDSNSKENLDGIGGNQISSRRNQIQTNIIHEKNNLISDTNKDLKNNDNENQSKSNLNNVKKITIPNSDDKNKNEINIPKEEHNLSNNTNINDISNSTYNNQNQNGIKNQTKYSNQSNINKDKSLDSKIKSLDDKVGGVQNNDEISKIEKNNKCMKCNKLTNNKNTDLCRNCLKAHIYEFTFNLYLADISSGCVATKIFEEQLELNLKKNEKGKKYLLPGAIKKYNEIFKDENLSQKQLINEVKKNICVNCGDQIEAESLELPCKCVLCSEEHLNEYLTSLDLTKQQCLCSERYTPEMLFQLGSFIIDKNINYNNQILEYYENNLKESCCVCGKKYDITLEGITYLTDSDNNYNEFLSKLNHNFCDDCFLLYTGKEFICSICQVKHILPN